MPKARAEMRASEMEETVDSKKGSRPGWMRRWIPESICLIIVAAAAVSLVWPTLTPFGGRVEQRFSVVMAAFHAPIMFALGHGMRDFGVGSVPEIREFIQQNIPAVDPAKVPEDIETWPVSDSYQFMHYYLLWAMGLIWRLLGVSALAIHVLCAVFYAATMLALYGLFRLVSGRAASLAAAVFMAASPAYLLSCPSLRDFSKAPFLLAVFFLIGLMLSRRRGPVAFALLSALTGLVAGAGYGFRQDLLVTVPAALAVVLVFSRIDATGFWERAAWRGVSALLLAGCFCAAGMPALVGVAKDNGSASAQAFVQGVSETVESRMDFGNASYVTHYEYSDFFDFTVVNSFARRRGEIAEMPGHFSAEHGRMGKEWMREAVRAFPGDMFARGVSAALMVPKLAALSEIEVTERLHGPNKDAVEKHLPRQLPLARHFDKYGLYYALAALVILLLHDPRTGVAASLLVVYFTAYPGLLFEFRHLFYLSFAPYWAAMALAAWALRRTFRFLFSTGGARPEEQDPHWRRPARRALFAAAWPLALVAGLYGAQALLRGAQRDNVAGMLERYRAANLEPVETLAEPTEEGGMLIRPAHPLPNFYNWDSLPAFESLGEYLAIRFERNGVPPTFRLVYEDTDPTNFSQTVTPRVEGMHQHGVITSFFPVYCLGWNAGSGWNAPDAQRVARGNLVGISMSKKDFDSFHGLYRMIEPAKFDLWPFITLPESDNSFVFCKQGPQDRFLEELVVGLLAALGGGPDARLLGYIDLARRNPGHQGLLNKVEQFAKSAPDQETAVKRWRWIVPALPECAGAASDDIEQFAQAAWKEGDRAGELSKRLLLAELCPENLLNLGRAAYMLAEAGRWAEAERMIRNAIRGNPEIMANADALEGMYSLKNDPGEPAAAWRALASELPSAPLPRIRLARALARGGNRPEAAAELAKVPENSLSTPALRLQHAWVEMLLGNPAKGRERLEKALADEPSSFGYAAGALGEAGLMMAKAKNRDGVEYAKRAVEVCATDLWHKVRLGEVYQTLGMFDEALAAYREVMHAAPESPFTATRIDEIWQARNKPVERAEEWRKLTDSLPQAAEPRLRLARAVWDLGDLSGAVSTCQEVLRVHPDHPEALLFFAELMAAGGQPESAAAHVEKALSLKPELRHQAGRVYFAATERALNKQEWDTVLRFASRGADIQPDNPLFPARIAAAKAKLDPNANATDALTTLYYQQPESGTVAELLDQELARHGGGAKQISAWQSISRAAPKAPLPRVYLGRALEASGDTEAAVASFIAALERKTPMRPDTPAFRQAVAELAAREELQ